MKHELIVDSPSAEAYPGGEMKHGQIALTDDNMPVIVLVPEPLFDKTVSNMQEVYARAAARSC